MGNTISSGSVAAGLDSYIAELGDVTYDKTLSSARFLKCVRGRHADGDVAVKLFVKSGSIDFRAAAVQMRREKDLLMAVPNALSYQRLRETDRAVYLVRQYIASSLYDRVSTRPFFEPIERRWLVFQLLTALRDCHARGIRHGDIKTENVLVTTTNWVYLTDFAFFKPTYLPEDDPAHFSYFFDTSFRRTCYLAPERFHAPGEVREGAVTDAMDVFSLGCVIAELFLEGTPLFDLSQLLRYKTGEYSPADLLGKIDDAAVRSLVADMVQLDPDRRLSADEYLSRWTRKAFPDYFATFLHGYVSSISDPARHRKTTPSTDLDDELDRIFHEYDRIAFYLGFEDAPQPDGGRCVARLGIPNVRHREVVASTASDDDGALILLTIVLSSVRNTVRAATRVRACDVVLALSARVDDEVKLDRVAPFLVALLADEAPEVRAASLRALAQMLSLVRLLNPVNAYVFPEYILPRLRPFTKDSEVLVRTAYAGCVAMFASTAARFLEMAHALRAEGFLSIVDVDAEAESGAEMPPVPVDVGMQDLQEVVQEHVVAMLTDQSSAVRRTVLEDTAELCAFLGRRRSNDVVLSHLITYLNDRDWLLRAAFFRHVVDIAACLGVASVEEYILPLMIQALTDTEEAIVEEVVAALTGLCDRSLVRRPSLPQIVSSTVRFLVHPNLWIREAVAHLIEVATRDMGLADVHCTILPQLRPHLRVPISKPDALSILQALRRPLSRAVLEAAIAWAAQPGRTLFWQRDNATGRPVDGDAKLGGRSAEDEVHLSRLRNLGLKGEDEWKLLALREYIYRVGQLRSAHSIEPQGKVTGLVPTTVLFESQSRPGSSQKESFAMRDVQTALRDATLSPSPTTPSFVSPPQRRPTSTSPMPSHVAAEIGAAHHALRHVSSEMTLGADSIDSVLRHRPSGVALPGVSTKAAPEVATSQASARGQIDRRAAPEPAARKETTGFSHTYTGNEPAVLHMLDKIYTEQYDPGAAAGDFGAQVVPTPLRPEGRQHVSLGAVTAPTGVLVAHVHEHTAAINQVVVAPNHAFFVTCADDGTVKVWDSGKLERNVANRARTTYRMPAGVKVKRLAFIENTYALVATTDDGYVHLLRVECALGGVAGARYGSIRLLRKEKVDAARGCVWVEHFVQEAASIVLLASADGAVTALDSRSLRTLYTLHNPAHHGAVVCCATDRRKTWLLLGSSRGILDLWDLRFRIRVRSIGLPKPRRIAALAVDNARGAGRWVYVAGGTGAADVTLWDLEKAHCRAAFRQAGTVYDPPSLRTFQPWDPNAQTSDHLLATFTGEPVHASLGRRDSAAVQIRAMAVASSTIGGGGCGGGGEGSGDAGYIVTADSEQRIRFWDLNKPESSAVVSQGSGPHATDRPSTFAQTQQAGVVMYTECLEPTSAARELLSKRRSGTAAAAAAARGQPGNKARNTATTLNAQQKLLHDHLDLVTDIAALRYPYDVLVSADRSGVLKVYA